MARGLYRSAPVFRHWIDHAARLLAPRLGADIRLLLEDPQSDWQGLSRAQPMLFAVEYALAQQWLAWGVQPVALLGLSLGELVAAALAGVFRFEDALRLVAERGAALAAAPAGSMVAVSAGSSQVQPRLSAALALAVATSPAHCVVSGPREAVLQWADAMVREGLECRVLDAPTASHHPMLADAARGLQTLVESLTLSPPSIPFISNLTGDWITPAQACDPAYWARHLCATVQFDAGVATLCRTLPRACLLEVGPGATLSGVVLRHPSRDTSQPVVASMRHPEQALPDAQVLMLALARLWTHGAAELAPADAEPGRRVPLPGTVFARERHWIEPVAPVAVRVAGPIELFLPSWRRALPPAPVAPPPATRRVAWVGGELALRRALR